jgi:hypothetical protein
MREEKVLFRVDTIYSIVSLSRFNIYFMDNGYAANILFGG